MIQFDRNQIPNPFKHFYHELPEIVVIKLTKDTNLIIQQNSKPSANVKKQHKQVGINMSEGSSLHSFVYKHNV